MIDDQHVHCVVTSCENPVTARRVVHLAVGGAPRGEEPEAEGEVGQGLIADVSIYLCDEHRGADAIVDEEERFPPG
jgi:hypothetical protein